tara:strand:- start:37 stop:2337 length:2301 start_codon:yes stop_codon:yes gene_type:complete
MKIGEYEQMMSYLTRPEPTTPIEPREDFAIGGGAIEGKELGTREGFASPEARAYLETLEPGTTVNTYEIGKKFNTAPATVRGQVQRNFPELKLQTKEESEVKATAKRKEIYKQKKSDLPIAETKIRGKGKEFRSKGRDVTGVRWPNKEMEENYIKDLKEKYSGKLGEKGLTNSKLAEKYFGSSSLGDISRVERINNFLTKDLNLKFEKADPNIVKKKRKRRLDINQGGKTFRGTDKIPFHHIMPIGGEVDLTTKDVGFINKQMNSKLAQYNTKLNDIADAISNQLNNQTPGYLDRIDELNKNAEQIIESVKVKLPKKYQNYIGFNRLDPITDEYGTPINLKVTRVGVDDSKSLAGKRGTSQKLKNFTQKSLMDQIKDLKLTNKKSKGVMLGSAGDLDTAARLVKKDFQTAKNLFGKFAPQIAKLSLPAIKLALAETGLAAAFVPMDIAEGLTTKEVLTNLGTFGIGVPFKDIQERAKFVEEKGLGTFLTDALNKQMISQNIRPALNMPADFGASQNLTEQEQQAIQMFETEAREPIESRRKKLAEERFEKYSDPEFGFREGAMNGGIMRLGFADGPKDPKMNRRTFMKVMGGLASIPLLGKFMKPAAKVVESVAPVVTEAAKDVPPYFFNLVAKIKKFGEDVSQKYATQDREVVTKYKDFELTEDLATGEQTIQRMKVLDDDSASYYGNPLTEETYMNYKPSQKILLDESNPTGGVQKTMPEYEEGTAYIRSDREYAGDIVDEMSGISDDIFEEAGVPVPEAIKKK